MRAVLVSAVLALAASSVAHAETRSLADFDRVSASGGTRVELSIGPSFSVDVEGRDGAQIVTRVASGRLIIEPVRNWRIRGRRDALVRVSMPSLAALDASSGAEMSARGIVAGDLALEASSGAGVTIAGTCRDLSASASSGARINARDLSCESGSVDASSGADAAVTVSGVLNVDASSGASVVASGDAHIGDISLSSGGSLRRR